eukprot:853994-Prymnesium_polylepis.1
MNLAAVPGMPPPQPALGYVPGASFVGSGVTTATAIVSGSKEQFPTGVFKNWGGVSCQLCVAKTPQGLAFGPNS